MHRPRASGRHQIIYFLRIFYLPFKKKILTEIPAITVLHRKTFIISIFADIEQLVYVHFMWIRSDSYAVYLPIERRASGKKQCCGSGSDLDSIRSVDPDSESGSGSKGKKS